MFVSIPSELVRPLVDRDDADEDKLGLETLFGVVFVLVLNLSMFIFTRDSSTDAFFRCEYEDPWAELLSSVLANVQVSRLSEDTDVWFKEFMEYLLKLEPFDF